ncbi:Uncharacterised protein [Budvicia aquatica]|uniref:Uncharacterized protein n=2 Tax=Budvicia aquatica TaxID=82979 RepID=A0A484ZF71_9GAMM|nr:Uncharacterised protein [Budvicia aquatica]
MISDSTEHSSYVAYFLLLFLTCLIWALRPRYFPIGYVTQIYLGFKQSVNLLCYMELALPVLGQVISLATTHWRQDVLEAYVCTSSVRAHRQCFSASVSDLPPVWPEEHLHVLLLHRYRRDRARQPVFPDIF